MKLNLDNVTLLSADTVDPERTIFALNESMKNIKFKEVKLITSSECKFNDLNVSDINVIYNEDINSFRKVNNFMVFDVYKYIDTDYVMFVEWDGYVLNYKAWEETFLEFDYIGSPWGIDITQPYWKDLSKFVENDKLVGNSGFSIRSKKLLTFLGTDKYILNQRDDKFTTQDLFVCQKNRKYIVDNGFKFADIDTAAHFSSELMPYFGQFGWHGFCNKPSLPLDLLIGNRWVRDGNDGVQAKARLIAY
jgi:hypothetical protein